MMQKEQAHLLVDQLFAMRRTLMGDRIGPQAQAHFRTARREALLGIRAAVDHALTRLEQEAQAEAEEGPQSIPVEE